MLHKNIAVGDVHVPYQWSYADSTARVAATGFTATDVGKLARQLDDNSLWMLTDDSPVTWVRLGAGGGATGAPIQSISASVGANALTISASALTLDFRSATLGSGAVTTVSNSPANLVISSGSTLGTVSAQQSRIVVLAINNAGTIELAAVNIAGGNDLSETGVISTTAEGGAGGADSASTIYSTTARTNVAYRVIGYVESTQATAGTWATAPSTIQGYGGQALAAMSSLGYGQTFSQPTRALSTTYYNTTGKPIFVNVCLWTSTAAQNITVTINGTALITGFTPDIGGGGVARAVAIPFIVPPFASYSLAVTGTPTIDRWTEWR